MKLFQCTPNFSEGRDASIVDQIVDAIRQSSDVKIVDYSLDEDHNRSVITFIGSAESVQKSALSAAAKAIELIDLTAHKGGHPRIGAIDVLPITPLLNTDIAEAVALSHSIGEEIAEKLNIPVFFYEKCAKQTSCVDLANVRHGGFEALLKAGLDDDRKPDLGPMQLHPTGGAVCIGARGPLIAYNVNLASDDMALARKIAAKIRHIRKSGKALAGVKAIAVHLKSRKIAQISMNITRPDECGLFEAYSFICNEAALAGVEVLESELIGAIREQALIDIARKALKLGSLDKERILDSWIREYNE